MKIVVISDLHGAFPTNLQEEIKRVEPSLIVCCGDIFTFTLREAFFKHVFHDREQHLWEYVGKEQWKEGVLKDVENAQYVLETLDSFSIPTLFVSGNNDRALWEEELSRGSLPPVEWEFAKQDFVAPLVDDCEHIQMLDYSSTRVEDYSFIGYPASNNPGDPENPVFQKHKEKLTQLFENRRCEKTIFVCHNGPHNTSLDKIGGEADESVRGKHYGSLLARYMVETYQPEYCVHGHIDEGRGIDTIGNTSIMNVGSGHDGLYGVIDTEDGTVTLQ